MAFQKVKEKYAELVTQRNIRRTERELARVYVASRKTIKAEIADLVERYNVDGVLTYAEMSKYNRLTSLYNFLADEIRETGKKASKIIVDLVKTNYSDAYNNYGIAVTEAAGANISWGQFRPDDIRALINDPTSSGMTLKEIMTNARYKDLIRERQAITQGFLQGESYTKLAKRIQEATGKSFNDALRIARTEGGRSASIGQVQAYDDAEKLGIELNRIWDAAEDARTRPAHNEIDNQVADKEGFFHYQGLKTRHKSGWGKTDLNINCRCVIRAEIKEEKNT